LVSKVGLCLIIEAESLGRLVFGYLRGVGILVSEEILHEQTLASILIYIQIPRFENQQKTNYPEKGWIFVQKSLQKITECVD